MSRGRSHHGRSLAIPPLRRVREEESPRDFTGLWFNVSARTAQNKNRAADGRVVARQPRRRWNLPAGFWVFERLLIDQLTGLQLISRKEEQHGRRMQPHARTHTHNHARRANSSQRAHPPVVVSTDGCKGTAGSQGTEMSNRVRLSPLLFLRLLLFLARRRNKPRTLEEQQNLGSFTTNTEASTDEQPQAKEELHRVPESSDQRPDGASEPRRWRWRLEMRSEPALTA